jgi:hypothetical protein
MAGIKKVFHSWCWGEFHERLDFTSADCFRSALSARLNFQFPAIEASRFERSLREYAQPGTQGETLKEIVAVVVPPK